MIFASHQRVKPPVCDFFRIVPVLSFRYGPRRLNTRQHVIRSVQLGTSAREVDTGIKRRTKVPLLKLSTLCMLEALFGESSGFRGDQGFCTFSDFARGAPVLAASRGHCSSQPHFSSSRPTFPTANQNCS